MKPATATAVATGDTRETTRSAEPARRGLPRILPIADSYLVWRVFGAALHGLMWFAGLFLLFAIASGARRVSQDNLPLMSAVEAIALQMPRIVLFTIPAALLYGTVQTFVEMSSKGEITALLAGGMSLPRMLRAPLAMAALCAVFAFWLQERVVPSAEYRKSALMASAVQKAGLQQGFSIIDKREDGSLERVIQAESFDPKNRVLIKPSILIFKQDRSVEFEISAERAVWDTKANQWKLFNAWGTANPNERGKGMVQSVPQHHDEIQIDFGPDPKLLKTQSKTLTDNLQDRNFEMVSMRDLNEYRDILRQMPNSQKRVNGVTFGIHDKIATPLVCLAMVLIGAPLGIRPQRSANAGVGMGLSLAVLILYYLVWTICSQIGKGGSGGPVFTAYLPFLVTALIGIVLVKRKS